MVKGVPAKVTEQDFNPIQVGGGGGGGHCEPPTGFFFAVLKRFAVR